MLKAVRAQRLLLMEQCEQMEADAETRLAEFTDTENARATADARVAALEEALREATARQRALAEAQTTLRTRLEHDAHVLAGSRTLVKRLHRIEAHLQGLQRACIVFFPEDSALRESVDALNGSTPSSAVPTRAASLSSSRFRLPTPEPVANVQQASTRVRVLDPYSVHLPSTGLCYTVDAVQPSHVPSPPHPSLTSTVASSPAETHLHSMMRLDSLAETAHTPSALDDVLFSIACEAVAGTSCTIVVAGPSSSETQHRALFHTRPSHRSSSLDGGVLVQLVRTVLAVARKESTQYRVRLSLLQLHPPLPTGGDTATIDLLAGTTAASSSSFSSLSRVTGTSADVTESFVPVFGSPHWVTAPDARAAMDSFGGLVSAVPVATVEEVTHLLQRGWRRREDGLRAYLQQASASSSSYASASSTRSSTSLAGGVVALVTVESIDVRGRCARSVVRLVLTPSTPPTTAAALVSAHRCEEDAVSRWQHWSAQAQRELAACIKKCHTDGFSAASSCLGEEVQQPTAQSSLGVLSHFLQELRGGAGKAVLLCCCGYTALAPLLSTTTEADTSTTASTTTVIDLDGVSASVGQWLELAHGLCHAVHHSPLAHEPFCIPAELLQLQGEL